MIDLVKFVIQNSMLKIKLVLKLKKIYKIVNNMISNNNVKNVDLVINYKKTHVWMIYKILKSK